MAWNFQHRKQPMVDTNMGSARSSFTTNQHGDMGALAHPLEHPATRRPKLESQSFLELLLWANGGSSRTFEV
jgi:hypothetical protein